MNPIEVYEGVVGALGSTDDGAGIPDEKVSLLCVYEDKIMLFSNDSEREVDPEEFESMSKTNYSETPVGERIIMYCDVEEVYGVRL